MFDRGDCFVMPVPLSKFCPKTCGFCENRKRLILNVYIHFMENFLYFLVKDYLPFISEQEQLYWWLNTYQSGKYAKYARLMAQKETETRSKVFANACWFLILYLILMWDLINRGQYFVNFWILINETLKFLCDECLYIKTGNTKYFFAANIQQVHILFVGLLFILFQFKAYYTCRLYKVPNDKS